MISRLLYRRNVSSPNGRQLVIMGSSLLLSQTTLCPRPLKETLQLEVLYSTRALIRDGFLCERLVERMRKTERVSSNDLAVLQDKLLARTLRIAAKRIPFYAKIIHPQGFVSPRHVFEQLPIIDKKHLLSQPRLFYPKGGRTYFWQSIGRTSGTTGTPLHVVRDIGSVMWANASKKRHWRWSGFAEGMPRATLRGDFVVPPDQSAPPFWFFSRLNNQLVLSSRHLKPPYIDAIEQKLKSFAPFLLEAYPSTAYELALHLSRNGRTLHIPFVYTGSEVLYAHQREAIQRAFNTKIMDHYGMAERVAYATECEFGNLHVNSDYSYVEIVDDDGKPTDDYGYIVGTTFHNLAMPLIRYRLSDRTKWKAGACQCGRTYPMIEPVTGKSEDVIYGGDGAPVSPSVITFAFKELRHIKQSQVAQTGPGRWQVRVVPTEEFSDSERNKLIDNIRRLVDARLDVEVKIVDEIGRTRAGKYKWVVNEWISGSTSPTKAGIDA